MLAVAVLALCTVVAALDMVRFSLAIAMMLLLFCGTSEILGTLQGDGGN